MSDTPVPAYLVVCGTTIGEMDPRYGEHASGVAEKAELAPLAGGMVGTKVEVLEGTLPAGETLLAVERCASVEAAKEFYYSPEYQKAIEYRKNSVKIHFIAVAETITEEEMEAARAAAEAAAG